MPLLALLACLPNLNDADHNRPGQDDDPLALSLDAVSPGYAHTGGGTELSISGGPFDGSAMVEIAGVPAEILSVEQDLIVVRSPELLESGWAELSVETDLAAGELPDALEIFEEASGLAGTFGALEWYELQGDYWTNESEDWGVAWWGLIDPEDVHYWDLFDVEDIDKCVSDPSFPSLRMVELGVGETQLVAGDATVVLPAAEDRFFDGPLYSFPERASWGVPEIRGGDLPDFGIDQLATTPAAFDLYEPYLYGDAPPVLTKSDLWLEWGDVEADRIMIMVKRLDSSQEEEIETVACVAENDGAFHLKGVNWMQPWASGQWLHIYVGAVVEGGGEVPLNGSESRVAGVYWLVGAAVTAK